MIGTTKECGLTRWSTGALAERTSEGRGLTRIATEGPLSLKVTLIAKMPVSTAVRPWNKAQFVATVELWEGTAALEFAPWNDSRSRRQSARGVTSKRSGTR